MSVFPKSLIFLKISLFSQFFIVLYSYLVHWRGTG